MKKLSRILNIFASALVMIVGVAFVFVEGCLILTGDFLLFESPVVAFMQMMLRLLLAAGAFVLGLFVIIKKDRDFLFESLAALACTFLMALFLTNGFGLYFILLAGLFALTNLLYRYILTKQKNDE